MELEGYIPRIVDAQVERYLRIFGAVEISGTKWCGKTWTALAHAKSVVYVDDALELAKADPTLLLATGDRPRVLDEWQLAPAIWDAVRREVDRTRGLRGAFILTGSSVPVRRAKASGQEPIHSGAGRIGRVRMRPMSLAESGESSARVSLAGLFEGLFEPCSVSKETMGLVDAACRGGFPEAIDLSVEDAQFVARDYINLALSESIPQQRLDPDIARRILSSLARNLGQATTYKTISSDMFGAEEDPSALIDEDKIRVYLDALKGMYLIEEVPGWVPPARDRKRFATKPKRYLADPSLAVAHLGMSPQALVDDWQTFGLVYENMVMRDLMVYAQALPLLDEVPVRYYRDDSGLEADCIVQLADGRWAAIEAKVSEDKVPAAIDALERLRDKLTSNPKSHTPPPSFMAVIVGNGEYAREARPGIYVIPLRALGA